MKKLIVIFLIASISFSVFAEEVKQLEGIEFMDLQGQEVDAAGTRAASWFTAEVTHAGPAENGTVYIHLKDVMGGYFNSWFVAYPNNEAVKNQMLMVALKAIELNKNVIVSLESTSAYSTIYRLYIIK